MEKIYTTVYKSPVGELLIGSFQDKLCLCDWRFRKMRKQVDQRVASFLKTEFVQGKSEVIEQTIQQLDAYFHDEWKQFDLPILLAGTTFQKAVWKELMKIPFGKSISYAELTSKLGDPKAIRAVASANGANAIAIIIPCHRIIGTSGELVGYAGGLRAKNLLLSHEGVLSKQTRLFE